MDIIICYTILLECLDMLVGTNRVFKVRQRRWAVHPINQLRSEYGHFHNLVAEMRQQDKDKFFNFTRMSPEMFDDLMNLVRPRITKYSSNAIPAECRLLITVRFLATGDSLKSLHYNFRIGASTAQSIIKETCEVLWVILAPIYMKFPTEQEWLRIAQEFSDRWTLPNCIGAIDGKHVQIQAPKNSGSMFFNYLKHHSIVLLAICDAKKNFLYVDIGAYGGQSDGGVLQQSDFGKRLANLSLNLPAPALFPEMNSPFPFFFYRGCSLSIERKFA